MNLIDVNAIFVTGGIKVGDVVRNTTTSTSANVVTVVSEIELELSTDIFSEGDSYSINSNVPLFDYSFAFPLPSDCLRVVMVNQGAGGRWKVEGRSILCDDETLELKYIRDEDDYALWDPLAYDALSLYLAWHVCIPLTKDQALRDSILKQFKDILPVSRFVDATEEPAEELREEQLFEVRRGVDQGFVRDPMT